MPHLLLNERKKDNQSFGYCMEVVHLQVGQMLHALKMGWMKPRGEIRRLKLAHDPNAPSLDLWKDDTEVIQYIF